MAKLRIQGDSTGYVDLEAPTNASSSTLDLDQVPQLNQANTFTQNQLISGGDAITQEIRSSGNQTHFRMVSDLNNSAWMISNESNADRMRIMHTNTSTSTNTFPMYIYEAGYVTTPAQPAFYAYILGGSYGTTNSPIAWNNVAINRGNCFSTSTYRFTAPIAGAYFFSFSVLTQEGSGYQEILFRKNGADYSRAQNDIQSSGNVNLAASVIMELNVGDYVDIGSYSYNGANYYSGGGSIPYSFWCGHLLG